VIGPPWLADTFAAVVLAVAAYALGRLVAVAVDSTRRAERDVDAYHVAMGISMAGMLTGSLTDFEREAWAVVFAFTTVWFVLRLPWTGAQRVVEQQRTGHRLVHVLSSGAMVYMMLAVPAGSMAAMSMGAAGAGVRLPALAGLLAVVLVVATAADAARLLLRPLRDGAPVTALAPPVAVMVPAGPSTDAAPDPASQDRPRLGDRFLAPRLAVATEVVMGVAMAVMLVAMARS
jgi:hypothetical protein